MARAVSALLRPSTALCTNTARCACVNRASQSRSGPRPVPATSSAISVPDKGTASSSMHPPPCGAAGTSANDYRILALHDLQRSVQHPLPTSPRAAAGSAHGSTSTDATVFSTRFGLPPRAQHQRGKLVHLHRGALCPDHRITARTWGSSHDSASGKTSCTLSSPSRWPPSNRRQVVDWQPVEFAVSVRLVLPCEAQRVNKHLGSVGRALLF